MWGGVSTSRMYLKENKKTIWRYEAYYRVKLQDSTCKPLFGYRCDPSLSRSPRLSTKRRLDASLAWQLEALLLAAEPCIAAMSAAHAGTAQVHPFEGSASSEAPEPRARHLSRREQIWVLVEDSTIIGGFIFLVIVFSTVSFVLETEPALKGEDMQGMWFGYAPCPYRTAAAAPIGQVAWLWQFCIEERSGASPDSPRLSRTPLDVPRATALRLLPS